MKFCRSCGSALQTTPGSPALGPAVGAPMVAPPPMAPGPPPAAPSGAATIVCPRCATATPVGFAYCQQCGLHLNAIAPTDPGAAPVRVRPPSGAPPVVTGSGEPYAATLAAGGDRAVAALPPGARASSTPASVVGPPAGPAPLSAPGGGAGVAWATLVLVNRDGSDGQRFPLVSDDTIVGRAGADIAFDGDRFLARHHARLSRGGDGVAKVQAIDPINGVYKRTDGAVELVDGALLLVGREVLRFERVSGDERSAQPLVRHGVALFGSPPREPWGRVVQLVPSGGHRDVRYLVSDEIVLGREEGDIVFRDDAFMSRRHAAITWDGKRAQLIDLGSSNGSFVQITGATPLKHGDHVRMGDQLMRIER